MKAEYVNPFITATSEVFKTMVGIEPERGQLYVKSDEKTVVRHLRSYRSCRTGFRFCCYQYVGKN